MAKSIQIAGSSASFTSSANTTEYHPVVGAPTTTTTESPQQIPWKTAGTFSKFGVRVSTNSVNTATVFMFRKNTADTSMSISMAGSTTGWFEDITNTVTVAVDDLVSIRSVPGSSGTFVHHIFKTEFDTNNSTTDTITRLGVTSSSVNTAMTGASTTYYWPVHCQLQATASTTETDCQTVEQYAGVYKNLGVRITSNSRTATTVRLRKNTANGNGAAVITASTTGWFEDPTNTDTVAASDVVDIAVVNGTGTSSISYAIMAVEFENTANPGIGRTGQSYNVVVSFAHTTTFYLPIAGALRTGRSTEAESQIKVYDTYLFKGLSVKATQNSIANATTVTLRVNGADSALIASVTASSTGTFTDLTHNVTVASGDLVNMELTTGTGSSSQTVGLASAVMWTSLAGISTSIDATVTSQTVTNKFITKI